MSAARALLWPILAISSRRLAPSAASVCVGGVGWDGRVGRKAARMARRWPASSVVVTDELELRPLIADDVEPFLRSIDRDVRFWQGFDEQYVKTYAAVLEAATRSPDTVLPWRFLAVVRGGQFIGNYQLRPSIERGDVWHVQLGWWLAPEARGQGLGRASLAAALAHVHRDLGLRVARMGTGVDNVRAVRQIEAAGALPVCQGHHTLPNGSVVESRWYHHEEP
jgi:RimJ/RimL family protein N-acetyltransferase